MGIRRGSVCHFWQLVVLAAVLAACARGGGPAPVFDRANTVSPVATQAAGPQTPGSVHVVRLGDSLYELSRASGLPIRSIIDANQLQPPYTLYVGQRLALPVPRSHVVARGDTVYDITQAYGVDMASLVRLNRIQAPYRIYVGQRLTLPHGARSPQLAPAARVATAASVNQGRSAAAPVQVALATPPPRATVSARPQPPQATASRPTEPRSTAPRIAAPRIAGPRPLPKPQAPARDAVARGGPAKTGPIAPPPALSGDGLAWPVRGRILSGFGAKDGGLHNDGVNIAAPRGTPVLAAENGVVAYANSEINGFGKLLLIRHDSGLITAYAHNDALLVQRGDVVRKGQVVARVGASGGVSTPQLHFEVRRGTKAVDPRRFLATG